jgi:hypothetical protein
MDESIGYAEAFITVSIIAIFIIVVVDSLLNLAKDLDNDPPAY